MGFWFVVVVWLSFGVFFFFYFFGGGGVEIEEKGSWGVEGGLEESLRSMSPSLIISTTRTCTGFGR